MRQAPDDDLGNGICCEHDAAWKDADPGLPIFVEAKAEHAKLK